jgi:hypothetical protein
MKIKTWAIASLTAISISNSVLANELQLREASEHLAYLSQKRNEARVKMQTTKKAFKAIDGAYDQQKSVVNGLRKAIKAKEKAERKAIQAEEIARRYDAYLADRSHATGGVTGFKKVGDYAY